jgi:hypothetical protein
MPIAHVQLLSALAWCPMDVGLYGLAGMERDWRLSAEQASLMSGSSTSTMSAVFWCLKAGADGCGVMSALQMVWTF